MSATRKTPPSNSAASDWTFLNNHTHVLLCLARDPGARLRDVAQLVGITERAVQKIVRDLEECAVLRRFRVGRRNHYQIDLEQPLRHALESRHTVGELLGLFLERKERRQLQNLARHKSARIAADGAETTSEESEPVP